MKQFHRVLVNTLVANVTSSFLWFALTFWVYLETRSVLATSIVGGLYMLLVALLGIPFGVLVDRHKKKQVMVASSVITVSAYLLAGLLYLLVDKRILLDWTRPLFWLFSGIILIGGVVEILRNIALSTTVTLLVPDEQRAQANGLVGTVQGIAFTLTSVFSGLAIGLLGMGWTLGIAITLTGLALLHLLTVSIPEEGVYHDPELGTKKVDLAGSLAAIRVVPGLMALIFFTCFNNLIGGVFVALMDPYGLTLFSVEAWGIVLGVTGTGFIVGGAIVAKRGLGGNPVRTLLIVNIGVALLGMLFTIREWQWLYALGIFVFMAMIPAAEAAEQTIIQRVVPLHRQGRVFGFAQSVESASTPISSFLIGPLAQFWLIPYMNSDSGKATWSWLLGSGEARGIAMLFVMASLVMLVIVLVAFRTKAYALLSRFYRDSAPPPASVSGVHPQS